MDKFYEHMKKKGFIIRYNGKMQEVVSGKTSKEYGYALYNLSNTELVGYMIEYLTKKVISTRQFGKWLADEVHDYLLLVDAKYGLDNPQLIIYDILKNKIEDTSNEKT